MVVKKKATDKKIEKKAAAAKKKALLEKAKEKPKKAAPKPKRPVSVKKKPIFKEKAIPAAPVVEAIEKPGEIAVKRPSVLPLPKQRPPKRKVEKVKPAVIVPPAPRPQAPFVSEPKIEPVIVAPPKEEPVIKEPRKVEIYFPITVKELSTELQVKTSDLIKELIKKNIFANINQTLSEEVAKDVAEQLGYILTKTPTLEEEILKEHEDQSQTNLVPRSAVVTLMGHVDHGKTSLLDVIRRSNVTEREAGGITQHIGAYRVELEKGAITFLDTPGHEAFTAMRARGATATDVVILVVAADDGVMPQTKEAIDHARAAGVPIVVAINKIDKPTAAVDKVKKQLAQLGLQPEDWGGKTITVGVSAKTQEGIDHLLEMVLLEAEMLELKANVNKPASGVVIEGRLSRGKGPVATVLVKNGTLKESDNVIIGAHYGKVRAMIDERGHKLKEAGPSVPVEILGLSGVPEAGDRFYAVEDEKKARHIYEQKQLVLRLAKIAPVKKITLEDIYTQIKEGKIKELKLILKADVQGSLEAIRESLLKMSVKEVQINIIHADVGLINDADIILAAASNAIVLGFNISISPEAEQRIRKEGVDVRLYRVIYDLMNDMKAAMEGLLEPRIEKISTGKAVVKQVFKVSKIGIVAGCSVEKGIITRKDTCVVYRNGEQVYDGTISSLKRFKDDVREVKEGFECGIALVNFSDIKVADTIEAYTIKKTARTL